MTISEPLHVQVNDELVLDVGTCEMIGGTQGPERLIRPPETALCHQVLAYLRAKPDRPKTPSGSMIGRAGVAAAAVILRWGSYLALLLDRDKPLWSEVGSPGTSRISDQEMARVNIEASAALADWVDIYRSDPGGGNYVSLVNRAVSYLPMPRKTSALEMTELWALADAAMATRVVEAAGAERLARVRADAGRRPSRVFANALVNSTWRNGPVENLHAGESRGYPIY